MVYFNAVVTRCARYRPIDNADLFTEFSLGQALNMEALEEVTNHPKFKVRRSYRET